MTTKKDKDDPKARLTGIVVEEVSIVDKPANQVPYLVVKRADPMDEIVKDENGELVIKADHPRDGRSREQLEAARKARAARFGIEVLETGSALTFPSGFPTQLDQYGDPVNLKFPFDTVERARNGRVRFKQFADTYSQDSSKRVVHTRIVEAELKFGVKPDIDPDDPLDRLLPAALRERAESKTEDKSVSKAGAKMSKERLSQLARAVEILLSLQGALSPALAKPKKRKDDDGVSKAVAVELSKRIESSVETVTKRIEVFVDTLQKLGSKVDSLEKLAEKVVTLEKLAGKVVALEKDRDKLSEKLSEFTDSPNVSAALDVEVRKRGNRSEATSWPRDLNETQPAEQF